MAVLFDCSKNSQSDALAVWHIWVIDLRNEAVEAFMSVLYGMVVNDCLDSVI